MEAERLQQSKGISLPKNISLAMMVPVWLHVNGNDQVGGRNFHARESLLIREELGVIVTLGCKERPFGLEKRQFSHPALHRGSM